MIPQEIAFSNRVEVQRPALYHHFNTVIRAPKIYHDLIWNALYTVVRSTQEGVAFVQDPNASPNVVVEVGYHETLRDNNKFYHGVTKNRVVNGVILGSYIIINPEHATMRTVLHQLGHFIGFGHTQQPGPFVMGSGPETLIDYDPLEEEAWRILSSCEPGSKTNHQATLTSTLWRC